MRKPRTKDDYWYQKIMDAEPPKIYRDCPNCGRRVGISIMYSSKFCFMCGSTIYANKTKNEAAKRKYKFIKELEKKGIKANDKKIIRKKGIQKEIQRTTKSSK